VNRHDRVPEAKLTAPCLGAPITGCTPTQAALQVVHPATTDLYHGADIYLCNAYTLPLADKDARFKALLQRAAIDFPDGKSVVWENSAEGLGMTGYTKTGLGSCGLAEDIVAYSLPSVPPLISSPFKRQASM
jgi:hypothetical protein